jgi:exodeoxyribonuclease V alpha subunit
MAYMDELIARLKAQNNAMNAVIKTVEQKVIYADKETFNAFQEQEEQKAEELLSAKVIPAISFSEMLASRKAGQAIIDRVRQENELAPEPALRLEDSEVEETAWSKEITEEILEDEDFTPEEVEAEIEAKEMDKGGQFSLNIQLNEDQLAAKEMAYAGKSFVLTGAAGTGKTTAQRAVAEALLLDNRLSTSRFKTYDSEGRRQYVSAPSIAFCAFTRRAAANLAKAVHKSPILAEKLKNNIMTIHTLLEYEPETYFDAVENKEKFRFAPQRTAQNPLDITHLIIEESSMLDAMTLWQKLYDALPSGVQIIFIGDINQLPPVFGPSILNYALVQLPVIELKKVYRNQGIVLENAHHILKGETLEEDKDFVVVRGKTQVTVGQEKVAATLGALFNQWLDIRGSDGLPEYDPEDCIILSPFNVQPCGTDNLNKWIAQHLGNRRKAVVHEIIAGFNKLYLAVGDRVMFNKLDGVITDIYRNPNYHGRDPQVAGSDLNRFGTRILGEQGKDSIEDVVLDYSNFSLEALEREKAERKQQASHTVVIKLDNGLREEISATGDFAPQVFSLGYALTIHKAQGSEWRKVFIILHKDHAIMLYRELFYTAVTRARTKVTIVAKDNIIQKAIGNQRIKGNNIAEKIEWFNSGLFDNVREEIRATK